MHIHQVLEALQIRDKARAYPATLSQGEAQRVSIARAILNRPQLILADEPTASLDDQNCYHVLELIEKQASACNATLVVATHDSRVKNRITQTYDLNRLSADQVVTAIKN
jgi:putative ABC transport system ATP-binding protein